MVICQLLGGLGNQLFQYAAGRALSIRLGTSLKLDTSYYKSDPARRYELGHLNIEAASLTPLYDKLFPLLPRRFALAKVLHKISPLLSTPLPNPMVLLQDPETGFDKRFLSVRGNVVLKGFWLSERYFVLIADTLRRELIFRQPPDTQNQAVLREIDATDAVALHVRRGDYVANAKFNAFDITYYQRAIQAISQQISHPHFFIFSDDPGWTQANIRTKFPCTYVSHNTGRRNFEDLRLMSRCKHFIIANSTFSWWGAWLSAHTGKQVIAPRQWLTSNTESTRDLVPNSWFRL